MSVSHVERGATYAFLAVVAVGPLALGEIDTRALVVATVIATASASILCWKMDPFRQRVTRPVVAAFALLAAWTLVQALPLPQSLVAALSPHTGEIWARTSFDGIQPPSWVSLSLDPPATRVELVRSVFYLAGVSGASALAASRRHTELLERALVASGVVMVVATFAHVSLGATKVWGVYEPLTDVGIRAPLLNTNHLAAFTNIALVLSLRAALAPEGTIPRTPAVAAVLVLGAAAVWFASRGAIVGLAVAATVAIVQRTRRGERILPIALPLLAAAVGISLAVLALAPESLKGLLDTDVSKLRTAKSVLLEMVPRSPVFGVGRGAFESTYPEFRSQGVYLVWTHPENWLAQWASEWGVPVTLVAIAAGAFAMRPWRSTATTEKVFGAWLVVCCTFVHNLVDFNLETPAIAFAVACCVGVVAGGRRSVDRRTEPSRGRRVGSYLLPACAAVSLAFLSARGEELTHARRSLLAEAQDRTLTRERFRADLHDAILSHPAEPYFRYLGAARALFEHDRDVPMWVGRTLERAPIYPPAHLVLARYLRRISTAQSRLEYRISAEQSADVPPLAEVVLLVSSSDDALELAPAGPNGTQFLGEVALAVRDRLPASRARIDDAILQRNPTDVEALLRVSHDAAWDAQHESWCEGAKRDACVATALGLANQLIAVAPDRCGGYADRTSVGLLGNDPDGALSALEHDIDSMVERSECLATLATLAQDAESQAMAERAIARLSTLACNRGSPCIDNIRTAAALEDRRHNPNRALAYVRKAAQLSPDDVTIQVELANRASSAGMHAEASEAFERLAKIDPGRAAAYRDQAANERRAIGAHQ